MKIQTTSYKMPRVVFGSLIFTLISIWTYFSPASEGPSKIIFRTVDGLTILGLIVFITSSLFTLLYCLIAFRTILGLPALKTDGKFLSVYLFPFRYIKLAEIDYVIVKYNEVKFRYKTGRNSTIYVNLVRNHEQFFIDSGIELR